MNRNTNYGSITDPEVGFSGVVQADISTEFNSLSNDVATNVFTINSSIKTLQDALKLIGTQRDNIGLRNKIHVTQLSANQVAAATTKDINRLRLTAPKNDKQRVLQAEKLEGDFKEAVNKYYSLQKELAEKQKSNLLLSASIDRPPSDDEESEDRQKQAQLSRDLQFEQEMMLEREQKVRQIEADVLDVNQIMRELGSMVHSQGQTIDRIENSIDHTAGNVEEGTEQLVKASGYQTRHRKRLLILVLIAMIAVVILIAVLVTQLKR